MLCPILLRAHAEAAPGSLWAFDYLNLALEAYDRRDENGYATLKRAAQLVGIDVSEPFLNRARRRAMAYASGFAPATDHQQLSKEAA